MDLYNINNTTDTGTVTLEELESAFKRPTQRQDYFEHPETPDPEPASPDTPGSIPDILLNPDGPETDLPALGIEEPAVEVSPEKAKRTGYRIARLVDTGIDFALSNFVAHNEETYRADPRDLDDIAECWGEIAQDHDWNIGPEWQLAILYIMVYGPLVKQAMTDRRLDALEKSKIDMEQRIVALEKQTQDGKADAE